MPPVLIPIIAGALPALGGPLVLTGAAAGFTAGTATLATVLAYGVTTAATLGASLLLAQSQKPDRATPQQIAVKQALPPRRRTIGRDVDAGSFGFAENDGAGNLWHLYIHGEGEYDAVEATWLNDVAGPGDISGGFTALPWGSVVSAWAHLGGPDQTAAAELMAAFPGVWTADHRLRNLAYSVVRFGVVREKVSSKIYVNGLPAMRRLLRGDRLRDPRTGLTAWSENAGIAVMSELIHPRRLRVPLALVDEASFGAFADLCDGIVPRADGGSEHRYEVGFTYEMSTPPRQTLRQCLQACDGELWQTPSGKVGIRGGQWIEPTVTFGPADIVSYEYTPGNDRLAAFNLLKVTCTDPDSDYQPVELDPWEDLANQEAVGVLQSDLNLPQVRQWRQARRLAKIHWHKANPRHRLTLRTGPSGLLAYGEPTLRIVIPELGLDDTFAVEKLAIAGDAEYCDLSLYSLGPEAYEWDPETEEGTAPVPPPSSAVSVSAPEPTGFSVAALRTELTAGVWSIVLRGTVDAIPGTSWETIGWYRKVGATDWLPAQPDPDDQWAFLTPPVEDGAEYELEAAHSGAGGHASTTISARTDPETITATADPDAPDAPSLFSIGGTGSTAALQWYTGGSANFYATRVYRGATTTFADAGVIETLYSSANVSIAFDDTGLSSGTWYYWVAAINRSGAESAPTGPLSRTVT